MTMLIRRLSLGDAKGVRIVRAWRISALGEYCNDMIDGLGFFASEVKKVALGVGTKAIWVCRRKSARPKESGKKSRRSSSLSSLNSLDPKSSPKNVSQHHGQQLDRPSSSLRPDIVNNNRQ
jgi:hypothetical protein